jgi:hypothetical protein
VRRGRKRLNPVGGCALFAVALVAAGCHSAPHSGDDAAVFAGARLTASPTAVSDASSDVADDAFAEPFADSELEAVVIPPAGWEPDPIKRSRTHAHQAWLSPSRRTAYGVIRINLPLPFVGPDTVLPRFLEQMRQTEGEARLLSRYNDPRLPGIRFVAEGGQYRLRANLITRGFRAWAVYAGTLRGQDEVPEELQLAEMSREETRIGTTRVRPRNR